MAETDRHRFQITDPFYAIHWYFRDDPEIYVSANLLLCYDPKDKRRHLAPDLFVVKGVSKHARDNYLVWREKAPDVVIEITSDSTWEEDLGRKKAIYASLGVAEYYLFDPKGERLRPPLRAYRLDHQGEYVPVIGSPVHSAALGLDLAIIDGQLRLLLQGQPLPVPEEAYQGWQDAQARAEAEAAQARAEAERAERLRAQLRALGIEPEA